MSNTEIHQESLAGLATEAQAVYVQIPALKHVPVTSDIFLTTNRDNDNAITAPSVSSHPRSVQHNGS